MKHKALIHAALLCLQADLDAGAVPTYGICFYLDQHFGGDDYDQFAGEIQALVTQWPKSSGSEAYPVPAPSTYKPTVGCGGVPPAQDYFWNCGGKAIRWDANTEYGASRRELLTWMTEQTKD